MVLRLKTWKSRSPPGLQSEVNAVRSHKTDTTTYSFAPSIDQIRSSPSGPRRSSSRTLDTNAGWSSPVARQAHNLKVIGSNPIPATTFTERASSADRGAPPGAPFPFLAAPSRSQRHHPRDLAGELDLDTPVIGLYADALDEPAQDLKRFVAGCGSDESVLQCRDLAATGWRSISNSWQRLA